MFGMIFPTKISVEQLLDLVDQVDCPAAPILVDREELIQTALSERPALEDRFLEVSSSPDWSAFTAADCVLVATEDDDRVLPYIQYFLAHKIRFVPVHSARPLGYLPINSPARRVLEAEFQRQKSLGFAKWDFGPWDFMNLIQALETTRGVGGCYLEVGCYRGSSSCAVLAYAREMNMCCDFFFLDTFEGFNYEEALESADATWGNTHQSEGLAAIKERITSMGYRSDCSVSVEKTNIIRDPLPATVVEQGIRVANLDVDMYEAVYAGLCKLAPHVRSGGILICEDAGHTPLLIGARLAVSQFMESELSLGFVKIEMQSGQTFLIKR